MQNIALFFCLYARGWNEPSQCNSSHLRTMGFLSCLPGIWRALQCIRRYWDTGNKFPHLLNCGKYFATIIYYMTLSIYRMDKSSTNKAAFITFAVINAIYTSFWDIYYDWSLGDPRARHPFLRKELGYKKVWWYYTAMVIDPILRFAWVLYIVDPLQLQHSAKTSFCAALAEIFRRGMWSLFRVENEHCTNVSRFRASRDVPLPYELGPTPTEPATPTDATDARGDRVDEEQPQRKRKTTTVDPASSTTGADLSRASTKQRRGFPQPEDEDAAGFRPSPLQRAFTHVGDIFRDAHAQDFERKKRPELGRDPRDDKLDDAESETDESEGEGEESGETPGTGTGGEVASPGSASEDDEVSDAVEESALSRIREDLRVGMSGTGTGEGSKGGGAEV